jgi:hypothetical protein
MAVVGVMKAKTRLKKLRAKVVQAVQDQMQENAEVLLEDARKLAPELTRDLVNSGEVSGLDNRARGIFQRRVSFDTPYAVRWHEERFNPGPITSTKPGAGRKYLTRAFNANKRRFQSRIAKTVTATVKIQVSLR